MAKVKINGKVLEIPAGVKFGEYHHEIEKAVGGLSLGAKSIKAIAEPT